MYFQSQVQSGLSLWVGRLQLERSVLTLLDFSSFFEGFSVFQLGTEREQM